MHYLFLFFICLMPFAAVADVALPTSIDVAEPGDLLTAMGPLLANPAGKVAGIVVLGLMGLTLVMRRWGSRIPGPVGQALGSPWASWVLPMVFSAAAAIGTTVANGGALSLAVVINAVILALASGGVLQRQMATKRAQEAGAAAGAKVETVEDAARVLGGGGQ